MHGSRSVRAHPIRTMLFVLLLLVALVAPTGPLGADEGLVTEVSAPVNHAWPPTNPLDPNFFGQLVSQGPPTGWIYHGFLTFAGCTDLYFGASYFWRGSTTSFPTSVTSYMDIDANCLSTQYTEAQSRTTVSIRCHGGVTYTDTSTGTSNAASVVTSQANRTLSDLTCQPGSPMNFTMQARLKRPNGTFVYYCNKATGALGGPINELSSNTNPC